MPPKTRDEYNAYMRNYVRERGRRRRAQLIEEMGGKCVQCGSTEGLEIDHLDPTKKEHHFNMAGLSYDKLAVERPKAQLLCGSCHTYKSILDRGHTPRRQPHEYVRVKRRRSLDY